MTTKFKLICQDWTDLDGNILSYHFYYGEFVDDLQSSFKVKHGFLKLNANSVDQPSLIDFVLGVGKKSTNYSITIFIQVSGMYSMYTEYNIAVQVNFFLKVYFIIFIVFLFNNYSYLPPPPSLPPPFLLGTAYVM